MKEMIYADNAATTKLNKNAFEAMIPWLTDEYSNASQPYSFSREPKKALKNARQIIAECINASPDEIFFTSCGTESDNWAIKSVLFEHGCEVITSQIEHHAILNACHDAERLGCNIKYLKVTNEGVVLPEYLTDAISKRTKLVSIMLANNEIGTIEPIKELCTIAHNTGSLFHTDAVQAVGHIKIDVKELGVDMLSASAHKFNGPKGIGFLYIKKGTPISPLISGGTQEFGMRAGTENIASIVGMAVALKDNCDNLEKNATHVKALENAFVKALNSTKIDYIKNGGSNTLPGNINISFKNQSGEALLHRLDLKGICISTGSACDSVNTQVSHVIKAIGVPKEYAAGTIRVSLGKNNTILEVEKIVQTMLTVVGK